MPRHERFAAWQHCHRLVLAVYGITSNWPKHELFGLVAQVRRAAVSAPSNLAEGAAKRGAKEFARYLDIANGSLAEVAYLLMVAKDLEYMTRGQWEELEARRDEAARSLWGLYAAVRRRARQS